MNRVLIVLLGGLFFGAASAEVYQYKPATLALDKAGAVKVCIRTPAQVVLCAPFNLADAEWEQCVVTAKGDAILCGNGI